MRIPTAAIGVLSAVTLAACGGGDEGTPAWKLPPDKPAGPAPAAVAGRTASFELRPFAKGLAQPNQLVARPGDDRLYVVEQGGTVRVLGADGDVAPEPFLNLRDRVKAGGELGLLSATFTPDGRRVVVLYTNKDEDSRVVAYPAGRDAADRDRGEELLAVEQPYENHKGGTVLFDERGRLLVSLGDGGSAFDPEGNGQDPDDRLGGILRRERDGWRTVAFGLRNPWRMSFDDETGMLWLGDVGQDRVEEVDAFFLPEQGVPLPNLGWAAYEGHLPLGRKELADESEGRLTWPLTEYRHRGGHCSVTGGFVYRGEAIDELRGRYVYGDFCRGTMWSLRAAAAESGRDLDVRREAARLPGLASFGVDRDGELYAVSIEGTVSKLVPSRLRDT
ncbi:MAG: PQQ-dependent sugar dehydrogenase [Solirubrobacterales bacterium]|nr:PQQ-dependent sugar dehydrogenase [Solirubrobacterales bacterium]